MTAMQILIRCQRAEAEKAELKERIQRYRDSAMRAGNSALDGVGVHGSGDSDKLATLMGGIDAAERALVAREREYVVEVAAAQKLLDRLPAMECRIADAHYLRGKTLTRIARELNYSYGYIRNRKAALEERLAAIPEAEIDAMLPDWYLNRG